MFDDNLIEKQGLGIKRDAWRPMMKRLTTYAIIAAGLLFTPLFALDQNITHWTNSDNQSLELTFVFADGFAFLSSSLLVTAAAQSSTRLYSEDAYTIRLMNEAGEVLHSRHFRDPRLVFFDQTVGNRAELAGGTYLLSEGAISLRVPLHPAASKISIVSPTGFTLFEDDYRDLAARAETLAKTAAEPAETIIDNGDPSNRIDLLLLGDGYTAADTARFRADVVAYTNYLFSVEPYKEYAGYFNVHLAQVISAESGGDHPGAAVNTAFGSYYGCGGTQRLICADIGAVFAHAQEVAPFYDEVMLLVNDSEYGGSGGSVAISYNGTSRDDILTHEFGHSFGFLLDEYLYGSSSGSVFGVNCDLNGETPNWQAWIDIGSPNVGTHAGCSWGNYFRPTDNHCMMNAFGTGFCVVCREQLALAMNDRTNLIDGATPAGPVDIATGRTQIFTVDPLLPASHSLIKRWYVDSQLVAEANEETLSYVGGDLGAHTVKVVLEDTTDMVLNDRHFMLDSVEWAINVRLLTVEGDHGPFPKMFELYGNFPNPFNPATTIRYDLVEAAAVNLTIYDASGREVIRLVDEIKSAGRYEATWQAREQPSGIYFARLESGLFRKTIKMVLLK